MNFKKILESLLSFKINISPKYQEITQKWWKYPEENFLLAEFGIKVYMSLCIFSWIISSIGIVTLSISLITNNTTLLLITGIVSLVFALIGFMLFNSSNAEKSKYHKEKERYEKALHNKYNIDTEIEKLFSSTSINIVSTIINELKKIEDLKKLSITIDMSLALIRETQEHIGNYYRQNQQYVYNVNEPMELDAFKEVDSYAIFEKTMSRLESIVGSLLSFKKHIISNNESLILEDLEKLLILVPEYKENQED